MKLKLTFSSRLGYYFEKNIKSQYLAVFGSAAVFTAIIYMLIVPLLAELHLSYVVDILIHRGPIPYIIVFFFAVMISLLYVIVVKVQFERFAYHYVITELKLQDTMVFSDSQVILQNISDEKFKIIGESLIIRRLKQGLQRLFNTQDTNALTEYFKLRSEIEYSEMDSNFSTIKYFNWLIPTLGFIGTVLGIGVGIAGFANIIQNAEQFTEIKTFLPNVTNSLGVAFDTTFLALILSVVGMFITSFVSRRYGNLLEDIDSYCLDEISSRFKLHSTISEDLKDVFRDLRSDIENLLNSNRIEMENRMDTTVMQLKLINESLLRISTKESDLSGVVMLLKKLITQTENIGNTNTEDLLKSINKVLEKMSKQVPSKSKDGTPEVK